MDLLALAVSCGYLTDPAMTLRVIEVESEGQVTAIHDNTAHSTQVPHSLLEAVRVASDLIQRGHRIDVGLMQINVDVWLKPGEFPIKEAFDPCTNIRIGSSILQGNYARALETYKTPKLALWHALSAYNSGSDWRGLGYAERVLMGRQVSNDSGAQKVVTRTRAQHSSVTFSGDVPTPNNPLKATPMAGQ